MSGQMVASMRESQNLGPGGLARGPIRPDGSFTLDRLTPGRYLLQAVNAAGNERASTEVVVSGADLEGVRLVGMKAVVASGRLISDSALPLSLRPGTLMVMVSPIDDTGAVPLSAFTRPAPVNDDWTFETQAWPGRVRLMVVGSDEWMVRSIRHRGSDVTDTGIEFASGADLSDIEIELTSRVAQVVGTVTGGGGQLATEFSVLVFPEDSERRALGARYIRTARPDQYGQFRIGLLPAGTYRAIALERLDGDDARDLEFLDRLARVAASFTLLEGESKTVRLPLHAVPE
jgi:hypothetical protein